MHGREKYATDIVHVYYYFSGRTHSLKHRCQKKNDHYQYLNNDENMISVSFLFVFIWLCVVFYRAAKSNSYCSYYYFETSIKLFV